MLWFRLAKDRRDKLLHFLFWRIALHISQFQVFPTIVTSFRFFFFLKIVYHVVNISFIFAVALSVGRSGCFNSKTVFAHFDLWYRFSIFRVESQKACCARQFVRFFCVGSSMFVQKHSQSCKFGAKIVLLSLFRFHKGRGLTLTSAHVLVRAHVDGPGAQPTCTEDHTQEGIEGCRGCADLFVKTDLVPRLGVLIYGTLNPQMTIVYLLNSSSYRGLRPAKQPEIDK